MSDISVLPLELIQVILSHVPHSSLVSCMLVCKQWNALFMSNESFIWQSQLDAKFPQLNPKLLNEPDLSQDSLYKEQYQPHKVDCTSSINIYRAMFSKPHFDKTIRVSDLEYSASGLKLTKLTDHPDASIGLVDRPFNIGQGISRVYIEFRVTKHDEMWIGVTDNPHLLVQVTGWDIVNNAATWAYNEKRTGIEIRNKNVKVEGYGTGDIIGVKLKKTSDDKVWISFYKNKKRVATSEGNNKWEIDTVKNENGDFVFFKFFVMVDMKNDALEIVSYEVDNVKIKI